MLVRIFWIASVTFWKGYSDNNFHNATHLSHIFWDHHVLVDFHLSILAPALLSLNQGDIVPLQHDPPQLLYTRVTRIMDGMSIQENQGLYFRISGETRRHRHLLCLPLKMNLGGLVQHQVHVLVKTCKFSQCSMWHRLKQMWVHLTNLLNMTKLQ